jgi:hypothetical protein
MRKIIATLMLAVGALGLMALPAGAGNHNQPTQSGLVNVYVEDLTVQVPIAVAANVCDVTVGVLVSDLRDGGSDCEAIANADAENQSGQTGNVNQEGLVNIALVDTTVQIPVGIAANICDVDVFVLAQDIRSGGATCDAVADAVATN